MKKYYSEEKSRTGKILFSGHRITIDSGEDSFYVHPPRASGYIHGDIVAFMKTRESKDGKMAEAKPIRLVKRSNEEIIIEAKIGKKGIKWSLLPIFGALTIEVTSNPKAEDGDLFRGKFDTGKRVKIIEKFGNQRDPHILEELIFFQSGVRTQWPSDVESYKVEIPVIEGINTFGKNLEKLGTQRGSGENTVGVRGEQRSDGQSERVYAPPRPLVTFSHESNIKEIGGEEESSSFKGTPKSAGLLRPPGELLSSFHSDSPFPSQGREQNTEFGLTTLPQSLSLKNDIFAKIRVNGKDRLDFRSWYTMTIDGADAKDLDDAISIAKYEGGDTLLGVHIADVAEYVKEKSLLDQEAYLRGTSIYTPGRVIPMLPEMLSNDLCSLHPGGPKLVLSILIRIDRSGFVKESFVTEGIIESRHRGVYEEIPVLSSGASRRIQEPRNMDPSLHSGGQTPVPIAILKHFSELYHTLSERRKKEGKIIFATTEVYFDLDAERRPIGVGKRERGDAHMMIEEFMVLANEEVAKWCVKRHIPFLSRVHDAPSAEKTREIHDVLSANISELGIVNLDVGIEIEPHHIRSILEHAKNENDLYRFSRLLLPKMAKAVYREKPVRHFGLALSHYAHFTSPIRRYPDLLLHRMIKYHLSKVTNFDKKSYDRQMKKWGESLSEKERNAEDVSRAIDDVYMCLYMSKYVGEIYDGTISGVTESNVYVELENGVEGAIYLKGVHGSPRLTPDLARGSLRNTKGEEIYRIGGKVKVKIASIDMEARRIEMVL